jgi:hypothetical protein
MPLINYLKRNKCLYKIVNNTILLQIFFIIEEWKFKDIKIKLKKMMEVIMKFVN